MHTWLLDLLPAFTKSFLLGGGDFKVWERACDMNLHQMGTCKVIEDLAQFKNLSKCGGGDDEVSLEFHSMLVTKNFIPLDHIFK